MVALQHLQLPATLSIVPPTNDYADNELFSPKKYSPATRQLIKRRLSEAKKQQQHHSIDHTQLSVDTLHLKPRAKPLKPQTPTHCTAGHQCAQPLFANGACIKHVLQHNNSSHSYANSSHSTIDVLRELYCLYAVTQLSARSDNVTQWHFPSLTAMHVVVLTENHKEHRRTLTVDGVSVYSERLQSGTVLVHTKLPQQGSNVHTLAVSCDANSRPQLFIDSIDFDTDREQFIASYLTTQQCQVTADQWEAVQALAADWNVHQSVLHMRYSQKVSRVVYSFTILSATQTIQVVRCHSGRNLTIVVDGLAAHVKQHLLPLGALADQSVDYKFDVDGVECCVSVHRLSRAHPAAEGVIYDKHYSYELCIGGVLHSTMMKLLAPVSIAAVSDVAFQQFAPTSRVTDIARKLISEDADNDADADDHASIASTLSPTTTRSVGSEGSWLKMSRSTSLQSIAGMDEPRRSF